MINDRYSMIVSIDDFDYKWCRKKGCWCDKDTFGFECNTCNRR